MNQCQEQSLESDIPTENHTLESSYLSELFPLLPLKATRMKLARERVTAFVKGHAKSQISTLDTGTQE